MSYLASIDEPICLQVLAVVDPLPRPVVEIAKRAGVSTALATVTLSILANTGRVVTGYQPYKSKQRLVYSRRAA